MRTSGEIKVQLTKQFTPLEKSAVKLTVTVAKDDVAKSYKENVAKLSKQIQIPGFRKGHVPLNVLEKKYGDALKADVLGEIIDDTLNEVFKDEAEKENRPLPYCQPKLEEMPALDLEKDLVYTVSYDIFPKVKVENFKGIEVKEAQVEIGEKELAEELKAIQERNATIEDKADGETVKKDDIVTIDYCELDDAGNVVEGSKREGFVFTVGTGENIYKIDDEIIGMKKDEPKEIMKTYAADDADKDLAGKTKKIRVTVKAMKIRRLPALDDDLAQDVSEKFKTLDDLKNDLKINMESAAARRVNELKSNSLLEQLVEKNPFEIPASMLETELNGRWEMMANQFRTTPEQLEKMIVASGQTKEQMLAQWTGDSEKMLKSRIIVDSLIRARNISVTPEEIEEKYKEIAAQSNSTVEEVKKHYEDARSKEYLIDDAKEQKLYAELYKEVKVSKGDKIAFADLFRQN